MAALSTNSNCVALTCGNKTSVVFNSGKIQNLEAPSLENGIAKELDDSKNETVLVSEQLGGGLSLVCSDLSSCGKWVVFCSCSKYLSFWNLFDGTLVSNRHLIRGASQVKFTPSASSIIVADKSGDVYQFSSTEPFAQGKLILGHLSMLLDILISSNEQYIITCDRDEKIRVSCFPNAYNIKSYCLGHEEFISSIRFLPHDERVLISASGDGTLRLWNYCHGNQIACVECYKQIENGSSVLAITCLSTVINDSSSSIVCVTLNDFRGCLVYAVNHENEKVDFRFISIIILKSNPFVITLTKEKVLWILSTARNIVLEAKCWNNQMEKFDDTIDNISKNMLEIINNQKFDSKNISNIVSLLYKRKFDNVQLYLEKKQARLSCEQSNKKIKNS